MKKHQIIVYLLLSLTFVIIRPFASSAQIDMGALFLQSPIQKNCFSNAETVTIRIKNFSTNAHNFVTAPVTVNANVTGPNATTFAPVIINTGSLPAGDSLSVVISSSYNMSAAGNYTFNANTTVTGDGNAANNSMPPSALTVAALVAGTINANPSAYCGTGGTPTLTLTGSSGGTIQWQESAAATGPWTNVGTNNNTYTPSSAISTTRYYRAYRTCSGSGDTTAISTVFVSSPTLSSTTPANRCGPGTLNLAAAASTGASVRWLSAAQGGAILATGNSFTTPVINATTTYYASSWIAGATADVGIKTGDFALCGFPATSNTVDQPLRFTTNKGVVLNSVWIIPSSNSVTLGLRAFNSTTNIATQTFNFTASQLGNPQQVNLNWSIAVPGSYQITNVAGGLWHITTLGCGYPFVSPGGSVTITSSAISSTAISTTSYYNGYYGINFTEGCQSVPVAVVATVNDNTAITQQPQSSISTCAGGVVNFVVDNPSPVFPRVRAVLSTLLLHPRA